MGELDIFDFFCAHFYPSYFGNALFAFEDGMVNGRNFIEVLHSFIDGEKKGRKTGVATRTLKKVFDFVPGGSVGCDLFDEPAKLDVEIVEEFTSFDFFGNTNRGNRRVVFLCEGKAFFDDVLNGSREGVVLGKDFLFEFLEAFLIFIGGGIVFSQEKREQSSTFVF